VLSLYDTGVLFINLTSIKFAISNYTLYMNTYDTVTYTNRDENTIVTMHGMELFSERTGFLIADRLALFHFFLKSIMLHSNKETSRIYAHWYTDCLF
jgi:hypothetical protein